MNSKKITIKPFSMILMLAGLGVSAWFGYRLYTGGYISRHKIFYLVLGVLIYIFKNQFVEFIKSFYYEDDEVFVFSGEIGSRFIMLLGMTLFGLLFRSFTFRDFEALDMVGGVLRVGGETVGFTMASPISADTLDVHFEKADGNMEGAYTMVNREFARFIRETKPHILWLNREDDMGLENLRRAKRSYYPEIILQKSALLWKSE